MSVGYASLVGSGKVVVGDCATGTRLQFESPLSVDDDLGLVALVHDDLGVKAIRSVVAGYVATAVQLGLPIVVDAPTWWARRDRLARAGIRGIEAIRVVRRCADLLTDVRDAFPDVFVCAPMGPFTDGYLSEGLDLVEAEDFHRWQVDGLAGADVDVVLAATFSTTADLRVAAKVLAETDLPFALGPTVDARGCLPDGRPIHEVIDLVESELERPPVHWALCCVHPTIAAHALDRVSDAGPAARARIRQVKGNGSAASPADRESARQVLSDGAEPWAAAAAALRERHDINVIGGCCGTDHRHFLSLAIRLAGSNHQ